MTDTKELIAEAHERCAWYPKGGHNCFEERVWTALEASEARAEAAHCKSSESIDNCRHCRYLRVKFAKAEADNAALVTAVDRFASFFLMMEAGNELDGGSHWPDEAVVVSFMGNGASDALTCGHFRSLLSDHPGAALLAELTQLRRVRDAAKEWDAVLSEYCDGPERDELHAALDASDEPVEE